MATDKPETKRCLLMPLASGFALLPSVLTQGLLIGESVKSASASAPQWLLGTVERAEIGLVPLLSLERLWGQKTNASRPGHIVLIKHVSGRHAQPFFALTLAAAPWVVEVDHVSVMGVSGTRSRANCIASRVRYQDREGVIPDLDALAELIVALPHTAI